MIRIGDAPAAMPTLLPGKPRAKPADQSDWTQAHDELGRIRAYGADWDGAGSPAPDGALVEAAGRWADRCEAQGEPPADRVILGVNGTVIFEWYGPDFYTEVEVVSPREAERRRVDLRTRASTADVLAIS